ncbi:hypothetical protein MLD38_012994 [Melastoma candidum]|uniref:Uncharacterized protein n=1 Tax=Melastoma candidum TaxID=119954 RepID=A0ACB9R866_9MYRT|nr:hypothetical protein MLD38_012994 [Melastoma candidum]
MAALLGQVGWPFAQSLPPDNYSSPSPSSFLSLSRIAAFPSASVAYPFLSLSPKVSPIRRRHFLPLSAAAPADAGVVEVEKDEELKKEGEEFSKTRLIAQNVPWTCTPEDIRSLFEKHGTVVEVELSMFSKNRNRGLAFIEMGSEEDALRALEALEASEFEGRTLKINYAKPKKKPQSAARPGLAPTFNLFVSNLSYEARAKDLRDFFKSEIESVASADIIFHDNPRRSSGYGFVSFKSKKDAEAALISFQGKVFMGRSIRVSRSKQFVKLPTKESLQANMDTPSESLLEEEAQQEEKSYQS